MKHIRRKFLFHDALQKSGISNQFKAFDVNEIDQAFLKRNSKDNNVILLTESGERIFSFVHNNNGIQCLIPVPDFSLVNYNFAYKLNLQRKGLMKDLLNNLADLRNPNEVSNTIAYDFQGCASSCIIFLYTAIECFVNDLIPDNFSHHITCERKTEIYSKKQIQISFSLMEKLTNILPLALNKNFFDKSTPSNSHIYHLKELRNDIIHTKSDTIGQNNIDILKRLLKFKYDETFSSTFKLFNYYRPGFIEECPCNENW
jgi:hypothetical protein